MLHNEVPGRLNQQHVPLFFPDWWHHPGVDKALWQPPLVLQLWCPPQVAPAIWHPPMKWVVWHPPREWPLPRVDIATVVSPRVWDPLFPTWRPPLRHPLQPVVPQPGHHGEALQDEHARRLQQMGGLPTMQPQDLVTGPPPPPAALTQEQFAQVIKLAEKCFSSYDEFQSGRGKAYSHVNLPAPEISILPVISKEMIGVKVMLPT